MLLLFFGNMHGAGEFIDVFSTLIQLKGLAVELASG